MMYHGSMEVIFHLFQSPQDLRASAFCVHSMIWFTHICVVFLLSLVDNSTAEISTWEPKAKRSDRQRSCPALPVLLKSLTSPVSAALASVASISHSALHRSLDAPTLGIRAPCHLPYTTVLSTPWRTFVNSLVLYVLCTPQCLE